VPHLHLRVAVIGGTRFVVSGGDAQQEAVEVRFRRTRRSYRSDVPNVEARPASSNRNSISWRRYIK